MSEPDWLEMMLERACIGHLKKFGVTPQLIVAMEEGGELIQALSKFYRLREGYIFEEYMKPGITHNLIEEIVDMEIMIAQLKIILKPFDHIYERTREEKITRAFDRVSGEIE